MSVDYRLLQRWLERQRDHAVVSDLALWRKSVSRASAHLDRRRAELKGPGETGTTEQRAVPLRWSGPVER